MFIYISIFGKYLKEKKTEILIKVNYRANFHNGWETEGATFAVYYKGKLVVDIWGGYADIGSYRPWNNDIMTIAFSSTKVIFFKYE